MQRYNDYHDVHHYDNDNYHHDHNYDDYNNHHHNDGLSMSLYRMRLC
jgi:hypothetical protein